jgi:hypothetical protein
MWVVRQRSIVCAQPQSQAQRLPIGVKVLEATKKVNSPHAMSDRGLSDEGELWEGVEVIGPLRLATVVCDVPCQRVGEKVLGLGGGGRRRPKGEGASRRVQARIGPLLALGAAGCL